MAAMTARVGSVVAVWRYPVKSMQGEGVPSAALTPRGVLGDRAYALLDRATGHIASAKHPRKWGRVFQCRATFLEPPQPGAPVPPIAITLPDGSVISSADPEVDQVLSCLVGRDVTLVAQAPAVPTREANRTPFDAASDAEVIMEEVMGRAAPAGTFFDYAPVHLLTTATLERLQAVYPAGRFDVRRFRPNIVVAPLPEERDVSEQHWLGHTVTIGAEAQLQLIDPSPRCVVTTLAQDDLPHDAGILRTLATQQAVASVTLAPGVLLPAVVGVYARVLRTGTIGRGNAVWSASQRTSATIGPDPAGGAQTDA